MVQETIEVITSGQKEFYLAIGDESWEIYWLNGKIEVPLGSFEKKVAIEYFRKLQIAVDYGIIIDLLIRRGELIVLSEAGDYLHLFGVDWEGYYRIFIGDKKLTRKMFRMMAK